MSGRKRITPDTCPAGGDGCTWCGRAIPEGTVRLTVTGGSASPCGDVVCSRKCAREVC
jgi:predicted nucleic acid-binding Zn ribbon protein